MSEWRDRGYVLDSDEEDLVLEDEDISTPTTAVTPRREASPELNDDIGPRPVNEETLEPEARTADNPGPLSSLATDTTHAKENQGDQEEQHENGERRQDGSIPNFINISAPGIVEPSEETDNRDKTFDLPQDDSEAQQNAHQQPSAGQPIVLITQPRRAESPPESTNRNVRTYSRKFKLGALKRIKSTIATTEHAGQEEEKDDGFMDIDALVGGDDVEMLQAPVSTEPLFAPSQVGRRMSSSSSDLSDVDMQVLSSPQPFFGHLSSTARTTNPTPNLEDHPERAELESAINSLTDQDLAALAAQQPRRNLRTRKAIQLHPYLIEVEQYRRSLKARGLRPIHVATSSQRPRDQDDSQDAEFRQEESQPPRRPAQETQESTPPDSSASPVRQQPLRLDPDLMDDDDDFPDLDDAIRRHVMGGTQIGYKRRKTLQTPQNALNTRHPPSSTAGARGKLKSLHLARTNSDIVRPALPDLLPPSPPRTSSPSNLEPTPAGPPRFRLPHGLTPAAVPTPLPSSPERPTSMSARRPRQIVISSDDEAASEIDVAANTSSSEESGHDDRQLLRMRRKIRGVLPASYLKLDRQAGPRSPSPAITEAQNETPRPTAPVRGVAQRRLTSRSAALARQNSYVVFSDNSGSESSAGERPASRLLQTRLPPPITNRPSVQRLQALEVDEHDEIDAMFPTEERAHFRLPKSRKKQSRVTDIFSSEQNRSKQSRTGHKQTASGPSAARKAKPHAQSGSKGRQKAPAKKPVQLSILDVTANPVPTSPQAVARPQFVRLAARQARHRSDHGRHSPTNKDIRLATREDTQDALEPLISWRTGNFGRSYIPPIRRPARSVSSVADVLNASEPEASKPGSRSPEHRPIIRRPGEPRPNLFAKLTQAKKPRMRDFETRKRNARNTVLQNQRKMLERDYRMRPAQIETIAQTSSRDLDPLTFAAPPSRLMEIFSRDRGEQSASKFRLERFLKDKEPSAESTAPAQMQELDTDMTGTGDVQIPHRARKRFARRFDVETAQFRQPDEPLPVDVVSVPNALPEPVSADAPPMAEILQGLGSFGTRYPTDFDIRPLELGTYFAASTFVGSGDFNDCLTLRNRDLDLPAGRITVEVTGRSLQWSAWDEDVSTGLSDVLAACTKDLHAVGEFEGHEMRRSAMDDTTARFGYFLRSVVRYISGCLHFLDSIDRPAGLNRISCFVNEFLDMVESETNLLMSHADIQADVERLVVDSTLYLLCIYAQCVRISQHPAVDHRTQEALSDKCVQLSRKLIPVALPPRFTRLREFLELSRQHTERDAGIQEQDLAVKSVVTINHVLKAIDASAKLPEILTAYLDHAISKTCNIHSLDQIWYDVFSVQPLLEIDAKGIYRPKSRFQAGNDGWDLVKSLLQRTFELYPATSKLRKPTLNAYVRACLIRVHHLIVHWGWHRCETALSTIYDFFARHNLSQLRNEEGKGSPHFLEDLDKNPEIALDPSDCAFHIFLKLIVIGLRGLQEALPKNKVRGFAWRFIPNHGRTYRKDQEVTHDALDALRNHHDLLCTLYWVMPPGCGPRLQMIKDLVDHENSHREACRLSVHAWSVLARYQLSQAEPFKDSDVLASWFKDMTTITVSQYRLARSEAEAEYASEKSKGSFDISPDMLETIITTNQRSIFAILQDLLLAMRNSVKTSKSWLPVRHVFEQSNVIEVLRMYDINQPRLSVAIVQALEIVEELLLTRNRLIKPVPQESQPGSDDSQDYGDWSFMDQVVEQEPETSAAKTSEVAFLQEPLGELMSTCFGSEKSPDDALLKKIVDVWTTTAQQSVRDGSHDWSNFLDTYSTTSWFQLRDTEQRHKYTCYFLASVIKGDKSSLNDHRNLFMKAWFVSLMERESMLMFQHRLTASLLERATSEPLLNNVPFAANHETGEYRITLSELRQRRTSLISSVLSNMHASLTLDFPSNISERKREYVDMLKAVMQHMRQTYEQLQDFSGRLGGSSHSELEGAYVKFVQQVISSMQQYTSEICPVDPFFVDSTAFPLPHEDPTYVISRLKSYVFKLGDGRARKQLAVFVQTVSERAASDGQQKYLKKQMYEALAGKPSRGLRNVMVTALLPAYISCTNTSSRGWVLATPLVDAMSVVFDNMICDLELCDQEGVDADVGAVTSVLATAYNWAITVTLEPATLNAGLLRLFSTMFGLVENSLTFIEYVNRVTGRANQAIELFCSFRTLADKIVMQITNPSASPLDPDEMQDDEFKKSENMACAWQDTLDFATRSLSEALSRYPQKEWTTDLQSFEAEKTRLVDAVEMFRGSYSRVLGVRDDVVSAIVDEDENGGDDEEGDRQKQEMQRARLDDIMRRMEGLGWHGLM
ncbi:hypothetical protein D6D04_08860 [Aureobasidium pullulans]|nr:hypothetical protein D6D04_08860 [Aureobasidium pullulans]